MAGYHCPMPKGIIIVNCPTAFSLLTAPICCLWHHSLHDPKQSNHARAAAAWKANNHIAQGNALGIVCRVMIPPRRGQKHFPPNGNAFALVGRRLLCYPCSPRALPWAGGSLPLSGVHSSERLLLMGITDMRGRNTRIAHSAMRGFVKEYSNFDPKKWGV